MMSRNPETGFIGYASSSSCTIQDVLNVVLLCRADGFETIMMNSNPETVSTDYDTSSRLYFEPLTIEDVLNVIEKERPEGIIIQFGGQTPLKLANSIQAFLEKNPLPASSGKPLLAPVCDVSHNALLCSLVPLAV